MIGGFFGLEMTSGSREYHQTDCFAYGRHCLSLILSTVKPEKIYIPYYLCSIVEKTIANAGIKYDYYHVNDYFEIQNVPSLKYNEYLFLVNYFGIKTEYINQFNNLNDRVIIDNTHAFFEKTNFGWSFNSARKFFGVSDGAYLYGPERIKRRFHTNEFYPEHLLYNYFNIDNAYLKFIEYENNLDPHIKKASIISSAILKQIGYKWIKQRRLENFRFIHKKLGYRNSFKFKIKLTDVPMFYPLWGSPELKKILIANQIFIPTFWPKKLDPRFAFENKAIQNLILLPIDHRINSKIDPGQYSKMLEVCHEHLR